MVMVVTIKRMGGGGCGDADDICGKRGGIVIIEDSYIDGRLVIMVK